MLMSLDVQLQCIKEHSGKIHNAHIWLLCQIIASSWSWKASMGSENFFKCPIGFSNMNIDIKTTPLSIWPQIIQLIENVKYGNFNSCKDFV